MRRHKARRDLAPTFRENGLSLVLIAIFLLCWSAELIVGQRAYNSDRQNHGRPSVSIGQFIHSGRFIEATAENWESEFLEMGAFVWLTAFLFQKGSPESKDPDDPKEQEREEPPTTRRSPWPVRRGGWALAVYARSLSLAFLVLFLMAFTVHAISGAWAYNEEQIEHGQQAISIAAFVGTSEFWFQSFQNWQSEFLGIFSFVILSIFLRQKGSVQSKPLATPHSDNE